MEKFIVTKTENKKTVYLTDVVHSALFGKSPLTSFNRSEAREYTNKIEAEYDANSLGPKAKIEPVN